jgi:glycosyltransferase involved in cell wall biosynthesis
MRLFIDARMLDHSGIGVYLASVLPSVLPRCAELQPVLLVTPQQQACARELVGNTTEIVPWPAAPLSMAELRPPPGIAFGDVWWSPHFNVPLPSTIPLVVTLHDLLPLNQVGLRSSWHKRLAVRMWMLAIRRRALRVICVSEFTRQEAVRLAHLEPSRVDVVHNGVDSAWTTGIGSTASTETVPYLLFVGLVKPHKNLLGLLHAFKIVAPIIPHSLIVVGRHTGLRDIDEAALALAACLGPRVELVENVSRIRLAQLVVGADLLVQPSFYEGFGFPPLEAMAAGTPVLAARAGAMPEICGEAALYCDPCSADDIASRILELIRNPGLRSQMRDRGLERVRHFTWEACAQATSDLLLVACGRKS